jgi:hypothetical protein
MLQRRCSLNFSARSLRRKLCSQIVRSRKTMHAVIGTDQFRNWHRNIYQTDFPINNVHRIIMFGSLAKCKKLTFSIIVQFDVLEWIFAKQIHSKLMSCHPYQRPARDFPAKLDGLSWPKASPQVMPNWPATSLSEYYIIVLLHISGAWSIHS